MKRQLQLGILLSAVALAFVLPASPQNGSIEFVAQATPTDGLQEPVRGFPIFLLSKSYEGICKEVSTTTPPPDMEGFIDKLERLAGTQRVDEEESLGHSFGEDFIHMLKVPDVMGVPEFYKAYRERNAGDEASNFPEPKFRASDEQKHPEKFKRLEDEYAAAIRAFMTAHPESIDGIDGNLTEVDPSAKWNEIVGKHDTLVRQRGLNLAESRYLIARTQTDLQGQGFLRGVPPGTYWLSSLNVAAEVGDAHPKWDVPVTVEPGKTEYIALSNANALPPSFVAP